MNLTSFNLLGHSFGAYVAANFAEKYPEKVTKLILADPWGVAQRPPDFLDNINKAPFRRRMLLKLASVLANYVNPLGIVRAIGPYGPNLVMNFRRDIHGKFAHMFEDTSFIGEYIYHLNGNDPQGEVAFRLLSIPIGFAKEPLELDLPKLKVDVAFIYGEHTWMDKNLGREIANKMNASYHVIPNSGHHIYIDNHAMFNNLVLQETLKDKNFER